MIYSISLTLFSALSFLSYIQALASNSTSITTTSASANSISLLSATQTVSQTLLSVPAYPTASGSSYSNTTALGLAKYLPSYSYNLTSESLTTRIAICNQTTQFCSSSACTSPTASISTNFCNPTTMGWNCKCSDGSESRLTQQPLVVPVNSCDCKMRASSCLSACQVPSADGGVVVTSIPTCQNACNYIISDTCGTSSQVIPEYQVNEYGDVPRYYPDTSKGGVALGITTSSSPALIISYSLGSPLFLLVGWLLLTI